MKKNSYNPEPLILQEGFFIDLHYDSFENMLHEHDNWEHHCNFQMLPKALTGHHQVLQLHAMQINYVERHGGLMNEAGTAKDTLSFAVLETCDGRACFDRMKPKAGDIIFFDDKKAYNFMTSASMKLCAVNMQKEKMGDLLPLVSQALMHTIHDTDGIMSKLLRGILQRFTDGTDKKMNAKDFSEAEEEIRTVLLQLLKSQEPKPTKLTRGEQVALDIRDRVYLHMDGKINVASLSREYQVSEKTLQNSFKSLFGFTPNYFFRQLKLNLIHNELKKSDPKQSTVSRTAQKWGFMHMGLFSKYYTDLFGENPSQTLKRDYKGTTAIAESVCVSRQEEII